MNDAAHFPKCLVDLDMCGCIYGRIVSSFHLVAFKVHNDHVFRLQAVVIHTAGLDDKEAALAVDAADIAPGIGNQLSFGKLHIGFIDLLL